MPSIIQALTQSSLELAKTSTSARLDAEILLSHVLNCTITHLIAWPETILDKTQEQAFNNLIEQRRSGIPVAYLVGTKEFWSLDFIVTPDTLIPRPETELLVEFILDKFPQRGKLKLVDLGTGSGAIAIAIASEKPNWEITATDISTSALNIAKLNADRHKSTNIRFIESNWFEKINQQHFDIIISNPPYIAEQDEHLLQGDVRFEPVSALTSGKTGLDDIEHIATQAKQHLKPNGWLVLEHGYDQKESVHDCVLRHDFHDIIQLSDLSGQPRLTACCLNLSQQP